MKSGEEAMLKESLELAVLGGSPSIACHGEYNKNISY